MAPAVKCPLEEWNKLEIGGWTPAVRW